VDATRPVGASGRFKPGIGPLTEAELVDLLLAELRKRAPEIYKSCSPRGYPGSRNTCDIVIPGSWAIEVKLARPFGDNGRPAERWSENVLYPYPGNTSSIGDSLKLLDSGFSERKAILVVGYEHTPPKISLEPAIRGFELLADSVVGIRLSVRAEALVTDLVHEAHQQARIYAWEVLGRRESSA
jgi:hypothetical protein